MSGISEEDRQIVQLAMVLGFCLLGLVAATIVDLAEAGALPWQ